MMAAFFTQLLNDNNFDAVYHLDNAKSSNISYSHLLDVRLGTEGEVFNFTYATDTTPFDLSDKSHIDTAIKYFKKWANYESELTIKTPYVPIKFKIDPSIESVDVVLVTNVGPYATTKNWPYFKELKQMLKENNISFADLNDFGNTWTNDPELLNKINNLLYKCKVFVGLDTGPTHYATGILIKKITRKNFIIQSGFNLFSHWSSHYGDLFQPIENKQSCAPCVLPNTTQSFKIPEGTNLPKRCNKSHACMNSILPQQVFQYIKNNI
jgi:ADP-heptose:LPS heptosyltransferase